MSRETKYAQTIRVDRLKELCKELNYSKHHRSKGYDSFIALCGLNRSTFYRVIGGTFDFSADLLFQISKATGVSIDWLFGLSDRKYINE